MAIKQIRCPCGGKPLCKLCRWQAGQVRVRRRSRWATYPLGVRTARGKDSLGRGRNELRMSHLPGAKALSIRASSAAGGHVGCADQNPVWRLNPVVAGRDCFGIGIRQCIPVRTTGTSMSESLSMSPRLICLFNESCIHFPCRPGCWVNSSGRGDGSSAATLARQTAGWQFEVGSLGSRAARRTVR